MPDTERFGAGRKGAIGFARRSLTVGRCVLLTGTVAILVAQLIFATTTDPGARPDSGARRLARFLAGISIPLVLVAAVLALTVAASIYVERLADAAPSDIAQAHEPGIPEPPSVQAMEVPVAVADDTAWRPS